MSDVTICKTCFCCGRGMIPINGEFVCDDCLSLTETRDEVIRLAARLAAAEAAARFYAKYYDGPAEALLCEEDRRAFMWIEENGGEP